MEDWTIKKCKILYDRGCRPIVYFGDYMIDFKIFNHHMFEYYTPEFRKAFLKTCFDLEMEEIIEDVV